VQGLTEFLPVSSSGHLVLFQSWLPVAGDPIAFDLALHLGTLVPVVWVYRSDLIGVARDATVGEGPFLARPGVRLLLLLVLGSIPTAMIGLGFEAQFEALFSNPLAVGIAFGLTGTVLWLTRLAPMGSTGASERCWWGSRRASRSRQESREAGARSPRVCSWEWTAPPPRASASCCRFPPSVARSC
jgi:undecaprenyl-diphosphatase